ncbi:MAG: disulfide bond formation protein B, partial [Methylococcales bacterium]|nr:disulfide bond formation protein B [Methylococcales bacterium]
NGTGECADVLWTFLGISIPGWTLVAFIALAILSLLQQWNRDPT